MNENIKEAIQDLLKSEINTQDEFGRTPLILAALINDADLVKRLCYKT